jgi:hypothetical protein
MWQNNLWDALKQPVAKVRGRAHVTVASKVDLYLVPQPMFLAYMT